MIEPMVSLAFSAYSGKGVYALLLGSGVSRAAGIPTGWEIVLDLIKKLALLHEEDCPADPEAWFKAKYEREPDYSDLLAALAKSPAERTQMLRAYFEPDEQEREQGLKLPTPAHRAVAELLAKGFVRVILTTNFDRLIEKALAEAGVEPAVISSADAAEGALPLTHAPCTLIKLHGDYLDTRIKNTQAELESYEPPMNSLLDRVLDDYGLIVCGWSAEWDAALRSAMERSRSRRFTAYWTEKDPLTEAATRLVSLRQACVIKIDDASSFFPQLLDKVLALEAMDAQHPRSAQVAVAQLKRYLEGPEHLIRVTDLVESETERVYAGLFGDRFPVQGVPLSSAERARRLEAYESLLEKLRDLMICLARWGKEEHRHILQKAFRRIATPSLAPAGFTAWINLRLYPALVLLYGTGVSAIAAEQFGKLAALLMLPLRSKRDEAPLETARMVIPLKVAQPDFVQRLPGMDRRYTPLSDHLWEVLRAPLRAQIPDDRDYEDAFDWFEYLLALAWISTRAPSPKPRTA